MISQPQLDLVTSLSLQQLRQKNFQHQSAQLSFPKFSPKNLESLSEQLCRNHSESLTDDKLELGDHFRQCSFQSFSFQLSRISLEEFIPQLDLVSLSLATELGSRSSSSQLQTIKSDRGSYEQRAFNCAALLGSTQLGHKHPQHTNHSFQLPDAKLCHTMAHQRTQTEASTRASKPSLITTNLARRSSSKRSSPSALPTSSRKCTTSSLQTTLFAILLFSFLFTNSFINNIFLNISFWKNDVEANNQSFKTAWEPELDKHLANQTFQQQLQQQLPSSIQESEYKKEKLELQEQNLELSSRSAYNKQFQDNNLLSNKAFTTELWNIQLFNHNSDNITLELAEDQLANKKQQQNKTNTTASQQLGPQQLRQAHLQLPQLSRHHADTAISRQLSKKPLPATGSQTAAWPAATLTASFSLSKKSFQYNTFPPGASTTTRL